MEELESMGEEAGFSDNQIKILKGIKAGKDRAYSKNLSRAFQSMMEVEVEEGHSYAEVLASKVGAKMLENASIKEVESLAKITGDTKESVDVQVTGIEDIIKKISGSSEY